MKELPMPYLTFLKMMLPAVWQFILRYTSVWSLTSELFIRFTCKLSATRMKLIYIVTDNAFISLTYTIELDYLNY